MYENIEIVKYLIEEIKVDSENEDYHGNTPLHLSSKSKYIDTIKYLIHYGVNINSKNSDSKTFIDYIPKDKKQEVLDFLRDFEFRKRNIKRSTSK